MQFSSVAASSFLGYILKIEFSSVIDVPHGNRSFSGGVNWRTTMKKLGSSLIFLSIISITTLAQSRRPITFDDLISFGRVSDPRISPNGAWIAFTVTYPNKVQNKMNSNIYLVPVNGEN